MRWSPQQDEALVRVKEWMDDPNASQCFRLFGYAGTGKTTLAKHFAEGMSGLVLFGAFTGKAAYVMGKKGCLGARTIHSMIYKSRDKGDYQLRKYEEELKEIMEELGETEPDKKTKMKIDDLTKLIKKEGEDLKRPYFTLNRYESDVIEADLVIIDECSMVDETMGSDLLSFGKKVLVLGDPAQLPPVGGAGYFTENVTPDVMLTEVHRQARDSPIIEMATRTRNKEPVPLGKYGNCSVVEGVKFGPEELFSYDQILVGTNKTRLASNRRYRKLSNIVDPYPVPGDRLVCLRNNHEEGLLNGAIFFTKEVHGMMDQKIHMDIIPEDSEVHQEVVAHEHYFLGNGDKLEWYEKKDAQEFDYGYALTVHKSQGSQYDDVLVIDESQCFRQDKYRWLYTAITRAAEKVTLVRM